MPHVLARTFKIVSVGTHKINSNSNPSVFKFYRNPTRYDNFEALVALFIGGTYV